MIGSHFFQQQFQQMAQPTNGPTSPENFPAPCHIRLPCNVSCASASAAETKEINTRFKDETHRYGSKLWVPIHRVSHIFSIVWNSVWNSYESLSTSETWSFTNHQGKTILQRGKNLDARCLWGNQGPNNLATHEKHDITESHCSIC